MLALLGLLGLALTGAALLPPMITEGSPEPDIDEIDSDGPDAPSRTVPLDAAFELDGDSALESAAPLPQLLSDTGSEAPDVIFGDILASGMADHVEAGAGHDHVDLRDGPDRADGGAGDDEIHGGRGEDTLAGGTGDDALWGHVGDDVLRGGAGDDAIRAGSGHDRLFGGAGHDALGGDLGDDMLHGGAGRDVLHGGAGDDRLDGTGDGSGIGASDFLNGGAGDDVIAAGSGDTAHGGAGGDIFALRSVEAGDPAVIVDFDAAQDRIVVLHPEGAAPELTLEPWPEGLLLRADGAALLRLDGIDALAPGAVLLLTDPVA